MFGENGRHTEDEKVFQDFVNAVYEQFGVDFLS